MGCRATTYLIVGAGIRDWLSVGRICPSRCARQRPPLSRFRCTRGSRIQGLLLRSRPMSGRDHLVRQPRPFVREIGAWCRSWQVRVLAADRPAVEWPLAGCPKCGSTANALIPKAEFFERQPARAQRTYSAVRSAEMMPSGGDAASPSHAARLITAIDTRRSISRWDSRSADHALSRQPSRPRQPSEGRDVNATALDSRDPVLARPAPRPLCGDPGGRRATATPSNRQPAREVTYGSNLAVKQVSERTDTTDVREKRA